MNLKNLEIKKKDLLYIVLTVIILVLVFIFGAKQLGGGGSGTSGVTVEVVQPIGASFNQSALDHMRDDTKSKDFVVPIDLGSGVGTATPFGQL